LKVSTNLDIDRLLRGRRSAAAAKYAEQGQYNGTVSVSQSVPACPAAANPLLLRARQQEISIGCCAVGAQQQRQSMRSRVNKTVRCPSVSQSVPARAHGCCGPGGRRYRSTAARSALSGSGCVRAARK